MGFLNLQANFIDFSLRYSRSNPERIISNPDIAELNPNDICVILILSQLRSVALLASEQLS